MITPRDILAAFHLPDFAIEIDEAQTLRDETIKQAIFAHWERLEKRLTRALLNGEPYVRVPSVTVFGGYDVYDLTNAGTPDATGHP